MCFVPFSHSRKEEFRAACAVSTEGSRPRQVGRFKGFLFSGGKDPQPRSLQWFLGFQYLRRYHTDTIFVVVRLRQIQDQMCV